MIIQRQLLILKRNQGKNSPLETLILPAEAVTSHLNLKPTNRPVELTRFEVMAGILACGTRGNTNGIGSNCLKGLSESVFIVSMVITFLSSSGKNNKRRESKSLQTVSTDTFMEFKSTLNQLYCTVQILYLGIYQILER